MEAFSSSLSVKIKNIELSVLQTDELMEELGANLEKYIEKAKETLKKKHAINPKPQKRIMRVICESSIEEEKEQTADASDIVQQKSPVRESLRPVRTAKSNANKNLKEAPTHAKMRNDNNVAVYVKTERVSTVNNRDSTKENTQPNDQNDRVSVDEGIQMGGSETDLTSDKFKRSQSVEIVSTKPVEIDITDEKEVDKMMMPPPIPVKKKKNQKQSSQETVSVPPLPVRITRSKIKKEKISIGKSASSTQLPSTNVEDENLPLQSTASESAISSKVNESTASKKSNKAKKYPMPILVKIERISNEEAASKSAAEATTNISPKESNENPTSCVENASSLPINETVTISTNVPMNATITIEKNNPNETYNKDQHDSLMTEDNDEDVSMDIPLKQLKEKNENKKVPPPLPLKFKKNEVFNPYLSSPVKQKVQAFEKHAIATPDKLKASSSKYSTLKSGTPSKIALYGAGAKTTPLNSAKQKYIAAISGSASSSTTSLSSNKKPLKKYGSLSHESNEDLRKTQALTQQLEEKKRQREEKQKQVQLQREAIEKQKREQTLLQQREREEKFRKIMQEKEDAKRMEALKKKMYKENQEKKFAEEKARKDEFTAPKEPQSASKDDSLYIKMQKQIIAEKTLSQKKKADVVDKNKYSFDMLMTDDSTDDESQPSKKRPEPPQWSKKQVRHKLIYIQSFANANLLDTLFSSQPINVNLKEIFPTIDARKLVRNSSAVWNTPPRYSQMPKY